MEAIIQLVTVGLAVAAASTPWSNGPVLGSWGFALRKGPAAIELFNFEQRFTMEIISFLLYVGLSSSILSLILYAIEQLSVIGKARICVHYSRATLLIVVAVAEIIAAIAFVYGIIFSNGRLWLGDVESGLYLAAACSLSSSLALTLSHRPGHVLSPPSPVALPVARVAGASGVLHYGSTRERPTEVLPQSWQQQQQQQQQQPPPPPVPVRPELLQRQFSMTTPTTDTVVLEK